MLNAGQPADEQAARAERRHLRRFLAALGCLSAITVSTSARAQPASSARLELVADPACATRSGLIERIRARSERVRFTSDGAEPLLKVEIGPDARGAIRAELSLLGAGGRRSARRVVTRDCESALDAMALIIAITLDPSAELDARSVSPSPRDAPEGATDAADRATDARTAGPRAADVDAAQSREGSRTAHADAKSTSTVNTASLNPSDEATRARSNRDASSRAAQLEASVGVMARAASGPAPSTMPGVAISALVALERRSLISPAVRLWGGHYWAADFNAAGGRASFALELAGLDLCPLAVHGGAFVVRPCAALLAGALRASGSNTFSPAAETRPFVALGGSLLASLRAWKWLELSASFAAAPVLARDRFAFSPDVFYRVAAVSWDAGLGLEASFP